MSNGSNGSSVQSQQGQVRLRRSGRWWFFATCIVLSGACHRAHNHQGSDLREQLSTITAEDLFRLGVSHSLSGDLLRGEQYLGAARQRGYDPARVTYWLVRVCLAGNRYRSALRHVAPYLRDHPSDWPLRLVAASIHEVLGDTVTARSELERIVEEEPTLSLSHYRLAMIYQKTDVNRQRAKAHLEAYLDLRPHGPHAAEVRSALERSAHFESQPTLIRHPIGTNLEAERLQ